MKSSFMLALLIICSSLSLSYAFICSPPCCLPVDCCNIYSFCPSLINFCNLCSCFDLVNIFSLFNFGSFVNLLDLFTVCGFLNIFSIFNLWGMVDIFTLFNAFNLCFPVGFSPFCNLDDPTIMALRCMVCSSLAIPVLSILLLLCTWSLSCIILIELPLYLLTGLDVIICSILLPVLTSIIGAVCCTITLCDIPLMIIVLTLSGTFLCSLVIFILSIALAIPLCSLAYCTLSIYTMSAYEIVKDRFT